MDTKTKKKSKKPTLSLVNTGPQIEYLDYPLNVEGVTQKGLLFPAHIRQNNNYNNNINCNMPKPIPLFATQEQKSTETFFFPVVPPNFWD